jgi:predicted TIM-barrel fold metal-dependent hydrolase
MVIDVHCHIGFSARRVDPGLERFSFEGQGAAGAPGYDSYLSPRLFARPAWFFVKRWLGVKAAPARGDDLDRDIERINERHWSNMPGVDRLVLLAFDEYHDNDGRPIGMAERGQRYGSDLYVSNTLVRAMCRARRDRYLFGGSIHPYRARACELLGELAKAGVKLIKWLPIHQNIDIEDGRSAAFLRRAAELGVPLLIHYGGEMSLSRQHMEFESPIPLLRALRKLRAAGAMPTVIVAHAATPSFIWQNDFGCRTLLDAMIGEFSEAPLYADISALAAFGRTAWLRRLARRPELHRKLLWGTDFPIPVLVRFFWMSVPRSERGRIAALPSWIERDLQLKRALGFDECVFTQAARILRV